MNARSSRAREGAGRPPSQRQLRVGELVRHALADILMRGEVADPGLEGRPVTVSEVRMSPDLKLATVFVMPLGGEGVEPTLEGLARSARFLRGEVARRVALKFAPDLKFRLDTSFAEAGRIDELLRSPRVARDLDDDGDGRD